MWFKERISLDDSNFDMENYSSLVDVKLLLKRILDGYWNKLLLQFTANGGANSEIGYTTDCFNSFWDRQKAEFCMLYSFVGTIANIYLAEKNWALLTDLLKVFYNIFFLDNCHSQKRTYSLNTHP